MIGKASQNGYVEVMPGIKIKTLNHGNSSLMAEFLLTKGALLSEHSHVHEQTGYLVKGRIRLIIDGTGRVMEPGDSWSIPSNVVHKAEIEEDAVAIEVFVPAREDYKKYVNEEDMEG
jgi:quercetin dioxygenase-like cupin family protein